MIRPARSTIRAEDLAAVLGPAGDPALPAALLAGELDGRLGVGLEPAFATRSVVLRVLQ